MLAEPALIDYYAKRAQEYERIYQKPERQKDLESLRTLFRQTLKNQIVLEIACGTGFWTEVVAKTAQSILATDINEEVLAIAPAKNYECKVTFQKTDAFNLTHFSGTGFTAGMAAAWWSHLLKREIKNFLSNFHNALSPGSLVVFMDNKFVTGSSTPISRQDDEGNTYQQRILSGGESYEVLKNFPNEQEVRAILADSATDIRWTDLNYYWFLSYRIK